MKNPFFCFSCRTVLFIVLVALCALIPLAAFAQASPLGDTKLDTFVYDFEKSGTQGWGPRGDGVKVEATSAAAHSGSYGLSAVGRSANWMGSAINLVEVLKRDAVYEFSAYMKVALPPSPPSTIKFSIEEKTGGSTSWVTVAQVEVKDNKWVQVTGSYSFSSGKDSLTLYAESSSVSDDIYIDDIIIKMVTPPPAASAIKIQKDIKSLKDSFAGYFAVGTAVNPQNIQGDIGDLVIKHFNSIVAENAMKSLYIQPSEGVFFWDDADAIVAFAKKNNMVLRYHTLCWHEQCPDWFFLDKNGKEMVDETNASKRAANKKLLLQRLDTHITTIVSRYKNDIRSWDVVNEVTDTSQSDGMRQSKWYQIAGKDFIETAFRSARAAGGPRAKLFINDYNSEEPAKREAMAKLITEMKAKGVPIDGVGHQTHIKLNYPPMNQISDSIKMFADMGLENHITELDISIYSDDLTSYGSVPEDLLIQVAYRYKELFDTFRNLHKNITNVTLWGISDGTSWLQNRPIKRVDAPLLFNNQFQANLSFWGIVDSSKLPPKPAGPKPKNPAKVGEALFGKASIDGKIESAWEKAKTLDVNVSVGNQKSATAKARVMWDSGFLYVLMEVSDPVLNDASSQVHEKDSVEVFMDENNAKTASYQGDDGQYRVNYKNVKSFGSNGESKEMLSATSLTKDGYIVEMAIPFRTIKGAENTVIGFDLQVNDADASAVRKGITKWNDDTDESWKNTLNWGSLKLVK